MTATNMGKIIFKNSFQVFESDQIQTEAGAI